MYLTPAATRRRPLSAAFGDAATLDDLRHLALAHRNAFLLEAAAICRGELSQLDPDDVMQSLWDEFSDARVNEMMTDALHTAKKELGV